MKLFWSLVATFRPAGELQSSIGFSSFLLPPFSSLLEASHFFATTVVFGCEPRGVAAIDSAGARER